MPEQRGADPFSLQGETALITGGGTGLGFGIAQSFVGRGARVVLVARRKAVLADAVHALGPEASYEVHDIDDLAAAPGLIEHVSSRVGPVSILVNNAGTHLKKSFFETSETDMSRLLQTHLFGAFALTRAVAPSMVERRRGAILFIASMASLMGIPNIVAYTVAKTAYVGLVRSLMSELSPSGVRVNAIAPGWIESPILHQALDSDPPRKARVLARTPMSCFGAPEDVGSAAVYLCSPAGRFVTGVVLPVDGGASSGF